jgi:hypothetical protein
VRENGDFTEGDGQRLLVPKTVSLIGDSESVSNEKKLMKGNCNMKNNMKKEFEDEDDEEL